MPVKRFAAAKRRLASVLDPQQRAALAQLLAEGVVGASKGLSIAVVCDDEGVAAWAEQLGLIVLFEPRQGLNGAVAAGFQTLHQQMQAERIAVVHSDLAYPNGLHRVLGFEGITLVPDHAGDGTNVLVLPSSLDFHFSYGKGSFRRHRQSAEFFRDHHKIALRVLRDPALQIDVDTAADVALLR